MVLILFSFDFMRDRIRVLPKLVPFELLSFLFFFCNDFSRQTEKVGKLYKQKIKHERDRVIQ